MELQLKIIGILLILLSLIHIPFPGYFNWKKEFQSISLINMQMMYVHTFFVALVVFLMGMLCVFCAADLIHTHLGKQLALGISIFWGARLLIQFVGYSSKLWKGKMFETAIHILFSLLWTYLTIVFFLIYSGK